ncbi:MAG: hypothetical protein JO252_25740 [Planctomycetaceae bacterium]|nr:hypothetical protein [Planctomycetaceae bacterium]
MPDPRRKGMPKRDHLDVFRESVESEVIGPFKTSRGRFEYNMVAHLIECAKVLRRNVRQETGRWPRLDDVDDNDDMKARHIAYFQEASTYYWKKQGVDSVPLEEVVWYRENQQEYAHAFYDAFYGHDERTPLP